MNQPDNAVTAIRLADLPADAAASPDLAEMHDTVGLINDEIALYRDLGVHPRGLGHIESLLSEINAAPFLMFSWPLDPAPLITTSFAADYEGFPKIDQPMSLSLYLDGGVELSVLVAGMSEIADAGGWPGHGPTSLQQLLDGIATLLSGAVEHTLGTLGRAGLGSAAEPVLPLVEAVGDVAMIREEAGYMLDSDQASLQALETISDHELLRALRQVAASPMGLRIQHKLNAAVDAHIVAIINEDMAADISSVSLAAAQVAIGKRVDLQ